MALLLIAVSAPSWAQIGSLPQGRNVLMGDYLRVPAEGDTANLIDLAERFDLLVLHSWSADKINLFRSVNPDIVLLLYLNRGFTANTTESVDTYFNVQHIDEMFMHDWYGNHIIWDWDSNGILDGASPKPENAIYQDIFINGAIQRVADEGWDGVFVDDLWCNEGVYSTPNVMEYATDFDLQEAMAGYLNNLEAAANAAGIYTGGNIGWWTRETRDGGRAGTLYLENLDLGFQEKWLYNYGTYWDDGNNWYDEIISMQDDMRNSQHAIMLLTRGPTNDREHMLYGLTSYLCVTDRDGLALYSYLDALSGSRIPAWFDDYEKMELLGEPTDDAYWNSPYRFGWRPFQNGVVIVNPNSFAVNAPGVYWMYDLDGNFTDVSGDVIPPHTGRAYFWSLTPPTIPVELSLFEQQ